ncbi:DUF2513 domain-containing protein [Lysinibacillus sp. SGAir0095]|uniref:DUF2513 domain-containing protein n=1 Tax=Lysinibacillus sp. SGAir0095 TaxID=2070463 RepID=UPI00143CC0DF|nr:DUF2513 domain-containing protein [Lysinibacillus sp. SGAir0095]
MKRDMELIRELLFLIEAQDSIHSQLKIPEEMDRNYVVYQLNLMEQAGLTENNIRYASDQPFYIHSQLTWPGHDFLDSIRNESIWQKSKDSLKSKGLELGQVSFGILTDLVKMKVKESLGMIE